VSLAPYEHTSRIALVALLVLDAVILGVFVLFARGLVHRALRPVAWMTGRAREWSEHDLDRRFALARRTTSLTALAATLDGLLGRLGASLRHEQRFSAEDGHTSCARRSRGCAARLSWLSPAASPAEMREALEAVLRHTDRMAQVVATLVTAAQRDADPHHGTVARGEASKAAAGACAELAHERGLALEVTSSNEPVEGRWPTPDHHHADPRADRRERGFATAARACSSSSLARGNRWCSGLIDDGPGVRPEEAETIFDPGVRGAAADSTGGAGLGLALARRSHVPPAAT